MTGHSERIGLGEIALAEEQDPGCCDERFAALVARQSRFVFRVAYAVLRNSHDAEDVVQEVFLKLYRSFHGHSINDERAYLCRIAWRMANGRRAKARDFRLSDDGLPLEVASLRRTPEQAVVQAEW